MATVGFTLTFWAWDLIAPLGSDYHDRLGLTSVQQSLLVAVPVLVGSLGRVPVGALTDRYGARRMFPLVSALTVVPVVLLIPARDSYAATLAADFLLGLAGTTFAIGVPLVNSWFPPARRGFALGVFGMGMGGVALSGYFTPRIAQHGEHLPFVVVAVALAGGLGPRRRRLTRRTAGGGRRRPVVCRENRGPLLCAGRYDRPLHPIMAVRRRHR